MWFWHLWRGLMRMLLREPEDDREEGPIENALHIGCFLVALAISAILFLVWVSK
jgi:hypothetical protein